MRAIDHVDDDIHLARAEITHRLGFGRVRPGEGISSRQVHQVEHLPGDAYFAFSKGNGGTRKVAGLSFLSGNLIKHGALPTIGLSDQGNSHATRSTNIWAAMLSPKAISRPFTLNKIGP